MHAARRMGMRKGGQRWAMVCVVLSALCVQTDSRGGGGGGGGGAGNMQSAVKGMQKELDEGNKGFRMLKSMGWKSGGLGPGRDGMVEPIDPLAGASPQSGSRRAGVGKGQEPNEEFFGGGGNSRASLRTLSTLEATQGQILSQSPTDATRFWWHLYGI